MHETTFGSAWAENVNSFLGFVYSAFPFKPLD